MTDEGQTTDRSMADLRRTLGRIALEIVVGFVGVYAAFALTAYHEREALVERRTQITKALVAEITPLADLSRKNVDG
ncbi:MAG: hypothetical protein ABI442_08910 [Gemmatimonadaceae bacterium]